MLQLNQVSKHFGPQTIFEDLTLQVDSGNRLGLIGRNGCGKSTILKLMAGMLEPDKGAIHKTPGQRVSYLSQEPQVTASNTLYEEMKSAFTELNRILDEETQLVKMLESQGDTPTETQLHRLDFLHREMDRLDYQSVDARIGRTLKGLGFIQSDHERKVSEFSGGWKMRINLAKILLGSADVLLLDEPTNHLDLAACEWLEDFLKEYPGAVVVVSHDRRFLDQITTEIAELELKAEYLAQLTAAYDRQQKEIEKQSAFVERFRASATRSTQAKSREKQLNKIERIEVPDTDKRRMSVRFDPPQPSGRQVVTLRGVAKAFGEKKLFVSLDADIQRGQRIFLLGANGCGKTTLFRIILGLEPLDSGEVRLGHQALLGYFAQNQLETLDPNLPVFDTLHNACPRFTQSEVRALLGRFLLTGNEVFKPVGVLSGGEKSKVALAKLMVEGPNSLLLDEPTNHMDIPAKEVLEEAFLEYTGTILCISHDRYFIQKLATHIWEIYEGRLLKYEGDYDYYLFKREETRAQALQQIVGSVVKSAPVPTPQKETVSTPASGGASPMQARKDIEKKLNKAEKAIIALEAEIASLEEMLLLPEFQNDYYSLHGLSVKIDEKNTELAQLNKEWEALAEALPS